MTKKEILDSERKAFDAFADSFDVEGFNPDCVFSRNLSTNRFIISRLRGRTLKRVLDVGCGVGEDTLYFAGRGAQVDAIDVSPSMVRLTAKLAKKCGLGKRVRARVMTAESLKYPSEAFDVVFGRQVVHHTDIPRAGAEVYRVLRKGGIAVFEEPLDYNPLVRLYRRIASSSRTVHEHPLRLEQLSRFGKGWKRIEHEEFRLFSLLAWWWYYFVSGKFLSGRFEFWWWRDVEKGKRCGFVLGILQKLDELLLRVFPFLKKHCLTTVIVFYK